MRNQHLIGTCLHCLWSPVCTEGKYKDKPCAYKHDIYNCISSIKLTKEMVEQFNETGHLSVTYERR